MSGVSADRRVTVLDGGMGRELLRVGAPFRQPEWSALALLEAPDRVLEAHHNFLRAGADVITANTYAVVPFHIGHERFAELGRELVELAARLARQAADETGRPVRVAGSIAPLFGSYEPEHFEPESAHELSSLWQRDALFEPAMAAGQRERLLEGWRDAVNRVRS